MDFPNCSAPFSNSAVKGTELSDFFKFYEVPHDILANNRHLQLLVCKNNKVTDIVCSPWTSFLKQTNQGFKLVWSSIHLPHNGHDYVGMVALKNLSFGILLHDEMIIRFWSSQWCNPFFSSM